MFATACQCRAQRSLYPHGLLEPRSRHWPFVPAYVGSGYENQRSLDLAAGRSRINLSAAVSIVQIARLKRRLTSLYMASETPDKPHARPKPRKEAVKAVPETLSASVDWNYITAIKIFHLNDSRPTPLPNLSFAPLPPTSVIQGYLCKAGREALGVSQAWLWQRSSVSRKTINDFENGFIIPKRKLISRLREALESDGAIFIAGPDLVGVISYRPHP
ncbi:hypothetical protein EV560_1025 [Bosea sp. BK604]|nr:hypothetical protein EV560_1025 [Bosea sp. BK604]